MAAETKKYGLLFNKKSQKTKAAFIKPSIFDEGSDDEGQGPLGAVLAKKKEAGRSTIRTQTQIEIEKALAEDPSVYEYDSVYDDIQKDKREKVVKNTEDDRKPKYINNLLKAAEVRKREMERRTERIVQKEREAEAGMFDDKEAFVTSAYKKKMEEMQEEEEKEKRQNLLESMMDVRKQQDLSGFYRHLLKQTTGEEAIPDNTVVNIKKEPEDVKPVVKKEKNQTGSSDNSGSETEQRMVKKSKNRSYRKRHESETSDEDDVSKESKENESHGHSRRRGHSPERSRRRRRSHERRRSRDHSRERSRERKYGEREQSDKYYNRQEHKNGSRDKHRSKERDVRGSRKDYDYKQSHDKDYEHKRRNQGHKQSHDRDSERQRSETRDKDSERRRSNKDRGDTKSEESDMKHKEIGGKEPRKRESTIELTADEKAQALMEKFAKRNVGDSVDDAKARYLARKKARVVAVQKDND